MLDYEELIDKIFSLKNENKILKNKIFRVEEEIIDLKEEEFLKITDIETEKFIDSNFKTGIDILNEILEKVTLLLPKWLRFNDISFNNLSQIGHQIIKTYEEEVKCDPDTIEFGFATMNSYTPLEKGIGDLKYRMLIKSNYYIYEISQDSIIKRLRRL